MFNPENGDVVTIDGEKLVSNVCRHNPIIALKNGMRYYIFENSEEAGQAAYDYWQDYVNKDPKDFIDITGADKIIDWDYKGSLHEWLDNWHYKVVEHFAKDYKEVEVIYEGEDYTGSVVLYKVC